MLRLGLAHLTRRQALPSRLAPASCLPSTGPCLLPSPVSCILPPVRHSSFFKTGGADELWKTMQGVSQQGKKRGRAKNIMKTKNLNRGQKIGYGSAKIAWPVLTNKGLKPTVQGQGDAITQIEPMREDIYEKYQTALEEEQRKSAFKGFSRSQHPLERGWSGGKMVGKKFGSPVSTNKDLSFDNFTTVLLEFKTVFHMTGNLGRVRRNVVLMATGNKQGAVGYTVSPGKYGQNHKAFRQAVNKSGLRLVFVDRYEERTVYHDFYTRFGATKIFVQQMPPGTGVKAHRIIRAICDLAGIKDLYAKVEGATNPQHIVKAFMLGLLRQKTHQALADEKGLHLVEMRKENDYYPRVVASPSDGKVRTQEEIGHNEILDFEMISFEGNLPNWQAGQPGGPKMVNPWSTTPQWGKHLRMNYSVRADAQVRRRMRIENGPQWGAVRSHLHNKYPECVERDWPKFTRMLKERKAAQADE